MLDSWGRIEETKAGFVSGFFWWVWASWVSVVVMEGRGCVGEVGIDVVCEFFGCEGSGGSEVVIHMV